MPRRKPEKVVVHRLELGDFERSRIDSFLAAKTFEAGSKPVVDILKDVSAMASIGAIIFFLFPNLLKNNANGEDYSKDEIKGRDEKGLADYIEAQNLLAIAATGTLAYFTGGTSLLVSSLIGAIGGTVIAEGAEEVVYETLDVKEKIEAGIAAAKQQARLLKLVYDLGLLDDRRMPGVNYD